MIPRLTLSSVSTAFLAFAAAGLFFKSDLAVAQQAIEETEEIVVEAPAMIRHVGRSSTTERMRCKKLAINSAKEQVQAAIVAAN